MNLVLIPEDLRSRKAVLLPGMKWTLLGILIAFTFLFFLKLNSWRKS
jgi:hypothetical protein